MRVSRTPLRVRSTLNLTSATLVVTLCGAMLSPVPARGVEPPAIEPARFESLSGGEFSTGSAPPQPPSGIAVEPVKPQVAAFPFQNLSDAERPIAAATLERVAGTDGKLVAHIVRPSVPSFGMVGVTWDQAEAVGEITAQVRSLDRSGWSEWAVLYAPDDEGPSSSEEPDARAGTHPGWVGASTGFEVALFSTNGVAPRNIEVNIIDPGVSPADWQTKATTSAAGDQPAPDAGPRAGTFPGLPPVITREEWGADESLGDECFAPKLGSTFKMVFVHHTAGSNDYEEYESAAVVRGVLAYHVVSRGWCDIGYNFLVDRYGNVFEGRSGGLRLPVRGAHSGEYNVNTTGISAMGNFDQTRPRRPMRRAMVRLIAWRLGTAYHGGFGRIAVEGDKFGRISGHRDAMLTACPGRYIYDWLPTLRERVRTRLGDFVSPIEAKWRRAGGNESRLGTVRIGEQGKDGGHVTAFADGRMYASAKGVFPFYRGPILSRYKRSGEVEGRLGYPLSGMFPAGNRTGNVAQFRGGRIYWSPATRSQLLVRSPVLKRYLSEEGPKGLLGFPTTGVVRTSTGQRAGFQHGTITFDESTRRTRVRLS